MDSKKQDSPIKQFGFNAGMVGNAMNTINNSTMGQQWASRNSTGTPTAAQNIDPNTAAMMNVAARPLFGAGSMASNMAKQAVGSGSITGIPSNLGYNPPATPTGSQNTNIKANMNTRSRRAAPINPKALSNQKNIKGVFGTQSPGTFTRNMQSPLQQVTEPPLGVEEEITPTYDLANN